jgi:hypothetical protein
LYCTPWATESESALALASALVLASVLASVSASASASASELEPPYSRRGEWTP